MPKSKNICLALSLLICAACSNSGELVREPVYMGLPAAMLAPCVVQDVQLVTTGDIVVSRNRYVEAFQKCAARVDAIRKHDAEARGAGAK